MVDAKAEAVRCWTNDPCGTAEGEPGTRDYAERLLVARHEHAPWLADVLGYATATGLDVLDVGCGQGIDLIGFARAGANVTGVDLTPRHVELAQAHLAALDLPGHVVEGDAERLPFPDATFDRVTSNGVLHHTPDMPAALAEIQRVLRPGGEARISLYHRGSLHYWLWQRLYERRRGPLRNVEHSSVDAHPLVRVNSRRELRYLLKQAGLVDVRILVRHFHWGDVPFGYLLEGRVRAPEWIGRVAGWYVIGVCRKR